VVLTRDHDRCARAQVLQHVDSLSYAWWRVTQPGVLAAVALLLGFVAAILLHSMHQVWGLEHWEIVDGVVRLGTAGRR
jgi:hypothetical protein